MGKHIVTVSMPKGPQIPLGTEVHADFSGDPGEPGESIGTGHVIGVVEREEDRLVTLDLSTGPGAGERWN